jgi:hypothetical protein
MEMKHVRALIGFMWPGLEQVAGCCEHGDEPPYSEVGRICRISEEVLGFSEGIAAWIFCLLGRLGGWSVSQSVSQSVSDRRVLRFSCPGTAV